MERPIWPRNKDRLWTRTMSWKQTERSLLDTLLWRKPVEKKTTPHKEKVWFTSRAKWECTLRQNFVDEKSRPLLKRRYDLEDWDRSIDWNNCNNCEHSKDVWSNWVHCNKHWRIMFYDMICDYFKKSRLWPKLKWRKQREKDRDIYDKS